MSLISVIIPVYNCDRYLSETIESVLKQTYPPSEIIIVDDGLTDKSAEVAKSFGDLIKYKYQNNSGAAVARNTGIKIAKGEYIAFLDADDLWTENKLKLQIEAFKNYPQLDIIFGKVQQFISAELSADLNKRIYCPSEAQNGYIPSTMMTKKESFIKVGYFDDKWQLGEFIDWYLKAQEKKLTSIMLPEILLKRRLHNANMGIKKKDQHHDYIKIIKASLDRKKLKN